MNHQVQVDSHTVDIWEKLAHGKKHNTKYSNFNSSEALKLQDVSDTDDQVEDADTCTMCQKGIPTIGEIKEHNVDRVFTVSSLVSFVSSVVMMLVLTVNNVIQVLFVCFFSIPLIYYLAAYFCVSLFHGKWRYFIDMMCRILL